MSNKKKDAAPEGWNKPPEEMPPEKTDNPEGEMDKNADTAPDAQSLSEADSLRQELAREQERYLRLLAEYDNYRKRSAKEREYIYADVRADTVGKFLPVYDNLERALAQVTADEAHRKGLEMVMAQFVETLRGFGVKPIETKDACFDPTLHNAVMHIEDASLGENVIAEEFRKGFMMGDKVIRFSEVKVAN